MQRISPRRTGNCNKATKHHERIEKEYRVMPVGAEIAQKGARPNEINEGNYAESNAAPNRLATKIFDDAPANLDLW